MTVHALKPKLTSARLLYGTVIALDQHGQQMVDFCGPFTEVREKIEREGVEIDRASTMLKGNHQAPTNRGILGQ